MAGLGRRIRERVARRGEQGPPRLSIVVPVYNVAAYLPDCLDSLLGQTLQDLEIIAVDDGSTDSSPEILAEYAAKDSRVRVLRQPNQGQGQARNLALAHVRGDLLTFCDSDDTVPPDAYAKMARTLDRTGSDFVMGTARRFRPRGKPTLSQGHVHDRDRLATTIDEFPLAMHDIIACNRMFRTSFWQEQIGSFPVGLVYEDHFPMLAAYVRANRFDVLKHITYNWRIREDQSSTGQQKGDLQNLKDRVKVKAEAEEMLLAEASDGTYDAWVARCLAIDFAPYLRYAVDGAGEYRRLLSETYRRFFDRAGDETLRSVHHASKIRGWLCAQGLWSELTDAELYFREADDVPPTEVRDGRVYALPEIETSFAAAVPPHLWELASHDSGVEAGLRAVWWENSKTLVVAGYAIVPGVSSDSGPPRFSARLVSPNTDASIAVHARSHHEPEVDTWVGHKNATYPNSAFTVEVEIGALTSHLPTATTWVLELDVEYGGLRRSGTIHHAVAGSAAHGVRRHQREVGEGWSLIPLRDTAHGFILRLSDSVTEGVASDAGTVTAIRLIDGAVELELATTPRQPSRLGLSLGGLILEGTEPPQPDPSDARRVHLPLRAALFGLPQAPLPSGTWVVRSLPNLDVVSAAHPLLSSLPMVATTAEHRVEVRRMPGDGGLRFLLGPAIPVDEGSNSGQERLQIAYRHTTAAAPSTAPRSVLFLSEDPRGRIRLAAISDELSTRRPELKRYWSVRDLADWSPLDCIPLIRGSRKWYEQLQSSDYLCSDSEPPRFLEPRAGQRHLRVFVGPPFEAFGLPKWRARNWDEQRMQAESVRRTQLWDAVAAVDDASAQLIRDAYGFRGDVLVTGDLGAGRLLDLGNPAQRDRARAAFGIESDTRVLLYAPTSRPQVASEIGIDQISPELDLEELITSLGNDHVVLQSGYANRRPTSGALARLHPSVRDVTEHPDLLSVMAASDVAILDYTGLRFDWASLGRPAVYFLPDREVRLRQVPTVTDFDAATPGPQCRTTAEVAAHLTDLEALAVSQRAAIRELVAKVGLDGDTTAATHIVEEFFS